MAVPRSQPVPASHRKTALVIELVKARFRGQWFTERELAAACMSEHRIARPLVVAVLQTQVALGHAEKSKDGMYRFTGCEAEAAGGACRRRAFQLSKSGDMRCR